ncbi:MAG: TolC family protein, partial [Polyangiaceae bacterium]|nr:TolC family protein [Polyangiaceae bacterium]
MSRCYGASVSANRFHELLRIALAPSIPSTTASIALSAIASAIVLSTVSCSPSLPSVEGKAPTSDSFEEAWDPATSPESLLRDRDALEAGEVFSPASSAPSGQLSVGDVVDLVMKNNPRMRSQWLRARASAASLGASNSEYYPQVGVGVSGGYSRQTQFGGGRNNSGGSVGPYARLSWLLLDFGGRSSRQNADLAVLLAANAAHNATIQQEVFGIVDTYYRCISAESLVEATSADVESAQLSLDAATALHAAGKANLGEPLQAQAALARARMAHRTAESRADVLRGSLATALGLPGAKLELVPLPDDVDPGSVTEDAGQLLERALRSRPDLQAARASAAASWQRANASKNRGRPTLSFDASAGYDVYVPRDDPSSAFAWGASLTLHVPLFTGYSIEYEKQRATWEALAAEADVQAIQYRIAEDVWTAYIALRTSADQIADAKELLATSQQWEQLARGRYSAGIGTIVDLMSAQSALATARSNYVQAKADWLLTTVRLSHAAGELGRRSFAS